MFSTIVENLKTLPCAVCETNEKPKVIFYNNQQFCRIGCKNSKCNHETGLHAKLRDALNDWNARKERAVKTTFSLYLSDNQKLDELAKDFHLPKVAVIRGLIQNAHGLYTDGVLTQDLFYSDYLDEEE